MNKSSLCLFGGALLGAGVTSPAHAGIQTTINDTLEMTYIDDNSYDNGSGTTAWSYGSMTIDRWDIEVLSDGWVVFDMLSYEFFDTGFDSSLWLFHNDGNEFSNPGNYIHENDDYDYSSDNNGSVDDYDSFIDIFLKAGQYSIVVGWYSMDIDEINAGIAADAEMYGLGGEGFPTSGEYQLDIYGDIALVPAPGALALLGFGALATTRRRR